MLLISIECLGPDIVGKFFVFRLGLRLCFQLINKVKENCLEIWEWKSFHHKCQTFPKEYFLFLRKHGNIKSVTFSHYIFEWMEKGEKSLKKTVRVIYISNLLIEFSHSKLWLWITFLATKKLYSNSVCKCWKLIKLNCLLCHTI